MPATDPSSQRRILKAQLRRLRDEAGMTQREAAHSLDWSLSKLIRVETGAVGLSVTDLRAMLQLYDVADQELIKELSEAARGSRGSSWWSSYRDLLSPQFALYLGHEGSASSIQVFHPFLIPGLLHTGEYGLELARVHRNEKEARRVVNLRLERQQRLFSRSLDLHCIINEEALYRQIGGPAVMRRQLEHLADMRKQAPELVQILPFSAGVHPGVLGPFIILGFADATDDMVFVEGASGDLVSRDDGERISRFIEDFEVMRGLVLSDEESDSLLRRLIRSLGDDESNLGRAHDYSARSLLGRLEEPNSASRSAQVKEDRWPPGSGVDRLTPNQIENQRPSLACSARWSATGTVPCALSSSSVAYCSSSSSRPPWGLAS